VGKPKKMARANSARNREKKRRAHRGLRAAPGEGDKKKSKRRRVLPKSAKKMGHTKCETGELQQEKRRALGKEKKIVR